MAKSLPPLASKGLALSLLVLALLAAAELTVAPLWRLHQAREARVDALREQALRFERLAAEAAARGALLRRLEQQRSLEALAFSEPNPALAAAALQGRLKSIVAQAGGKLLSTQAMPAVETGAYHRIAVRARLQASGDALPEIVYGIESAYPSTR
jgi:general secretion pathway protein M